MQTCAALIIIVLCGGFLQTEVIGLRIPSILGASLAVSGQFPWIVFIETPTESSCVGTIVNSRHILTSAQCVLDDEGKLWNSFWYKIIAGAIDLYNINARTVFRKLIAIYVHQEYNLLTKENDLAILRVDQDFPDPHNTIEIAEIYPTLIATETLCQFAGWSLTSGSTVSVVQHFFGAKIKELTVCQDSKMSEDMICAESLKKSNPCNGNLGGGLFCDRKLIGVLSYGRSCNITGVPSVYTDVRKYKTWINYQFLRQDIPKPGSSPFTKAVL